jgi:hypothetical protein
MNQKYKWWIIGCASILLLASITSIILIRRKRNRKSDPTKNIIIGDSQTPFIAKNTKKAIILDKKGSEESLWKGGMALKWLKNAVLKYKKSPEINSVIINIGTNGGFNLKEDVSGLVDAIKEKFPNAELYVVQGSWGWGGNKNKTLQNVKDYYDKFKNEGVKIIEPPIGKVSDPHSNLPIYSEIGKAIDNEL